MHFHLKLLGVLLVVLSLIHVVFPKYFNWNKELRYLSLINRQMMTVHTFFIALIVFMMGILCLTSSNELIDTNLGKRISLGLGLFWLIRLFIQLFIYSSKLWRGKTFESSIHLLFTILWMYFSLLFILIGTRK